MCSFILNRFIYFIDEVGFNVSMRLSRGRSVKGSRAVKVVPSIRSRNISVCCAISREGITHYHAQTKSCNTDYFIDFMKILIEILKAQSVNKACFIMNKVPFHKAEKVRSIIDGTEYLISFLPPYSPFLNPIENMFSSWKHNVIKLEPSDEETLFQYIIDGAQLIKPETYSMTKKTHHS